MEKKGQVTLFVILSVIIVIILLIVIFLKNNIFEAEGEIETTLSLSLTQQNVNDLVKICLNELSDKVIYDAGEHGGYSIIEEDFFRGIPNDDFAEDHPIFVPLVYFQCGGYRVVPEISELERTMEEALEFYLDICLNNFQEYKNQGWEVGGTLVDIKSDVSSENVYIKLNIPRIFRKDDKTFSIESFDYVSNINLPFYVDKSKEIIDSTNILLQNLEPILSARVLMGVLTEQEAIDEAGIEFENSMDNLNNELNLEGYDLFHLPSLDPPVLCSQNPELFMIRNRENSFRFVFGMSL